MKTHIFVEGSSDKDFLDFCLKFLNFTEYFEVVDVGGKDKLKNHNKLKTIKDEEFLVIFDADDDCEKARENVKKQTEGKSGCKVFLLPDDKSSGNLETLLEQIAKCPCVLTAFDEYVNILEALPKKECEKSCGLKEQIKTPAKKSKCYAYNHAFGFKNDIPKDKFKFEKFLDFESEHLANLKQFLNDNLSKNEA